MGISTALFQLLVMYYSCDFAATVGELDPARIDSCSSIYEQVKQQVAQLENVEPETSAEAYLVWKNWEQENSDLVGIIRDQGIQNHIYQHRP